MGVPVAQHPILKIIMGFFIITVTDDDVIADRMCRLRRWRSKQK